MQTLNRPTNCPTNKRCQIGIGCLLVLLSMAGFAHGTVVLEKVISREHPLFENRGKFLHVGRDGLVYLSSGNFLVRMNRDGTGKVGIQLGRGLQAVSADSRGNFAVGDSPHRGRQVALFNCKFEPLGTVTGFLSGEHMNWGSPCDVQSGESGDFYAMDQHRNRISQIALPGKAVREYSLQGTGEDFINTEPFFRVVESLKRFYVAGQNRIHALGFDGQTLWTIDSKVIASQDAFDADDEGNLYVLAAETDTIKVYGPDGKPRAPIHLHMADLSTGRRQQDYVSLELTGDEVFLKRHRTAHPTELFRVYNRRSGELDRVIHIDAEVIKAEFPKTVWTAGQPVAMAITLGSGKKVTRPEWPVQIARLNDSTWIELPVTDGKVTPPTDAGGLYVVRIGYGEYKLESIVEIRQPDSKGSVNVLTPLNRMYYGRGEEIPVTVVVRGPMPEQITLELQRNSETVRSMKLDFAGAKTITLPETFTAKLGPGNYLLTAKAPGYTIATQPLVLGPGLQERPAFSIVQGGDGGGVTAEGSAYEAPEALAAYIKNARRLGANLIMSRVGYMRPDRPTGLEGTDKRLEQDPLGIAPEKARVENLPLQTIAAHGAFGLEQQMILLHMDTMVPFLPEGAPYTGGMMGRAYLSQQRKIVQGISKLLLPYPAFRGWSWATNWWINMEESLSQPTEKEAENLYRAIEKKFEQALKKTGSWNPEFEMLSAPWVNAIPDTERDLNSALQEIAPGKINAATGPYRQPWVIPPVTFRDVKEVDLFLQAEQIQPPYTTPHNVDFYKRPGKRAWGHVDAGGEDGLGFLTSPIVLLQAMRGADGTGWEGPFRRKPSGRRGNSITGMDNDVRSTGQGGVSILRALSATLRQYGPWLTTLEGNDPIAIVVSSRMLRTDSWSHGVVGSGIYFNRLFEAYTACLFAHRPATFVFTEDVRQGSLDKFRAVLIVGQQFELDPPLARALASARDAGVKIYYDGTCREEHVRGFDSLNVAFNQLEQDSHQMNDDSAYWRIPRLYKSHAAQLAQKFGNAIPPVAKVESPEIMLTERRSGDGRFVWVLNYDLPDWEPSVMWRVGHFSTNVVGQKVSIDLNSKGQVVYDLFSQQQLAGAITADLRQLPARILAVLPGPIKSVRLTAPAKAKAGDKLPWKLVIDGPKTKYPLQLRLLDANGSLIEEQNPITTEGEIAAPINTTATLTLEATELISGKQAQQKIELSNCIASNDYQMDSPAGKIRPIQDFYGPHVRDVAVSADGSTALLNAMNWEENYYLLDTHTGAVKTQGNVGHQFAYGPIATSAGFFVQGYDLTTGEGYHLYDLGAEGKPSRRFALYGLPDRWQGWRAMGILSDRLNNFTVSSDGSWIATASNLGLIVWDNAGKKLWSQDWWTEKRKEVHLLKPDDETLVTLADMTATAYRATTGEKLWEVKFADTGLFEGGAASADGRTIAAYSHTDSGRVYVVRNGKLINTLMVMADNVYLSPDGLHLLVLVGGDELRWYNSDGGLQWAFRADDYVIGPQISRDGKRIVVGDHSSSLYVIDNRGHKVFERDCGSVPMAKWLAGGDLLVATWMGKVIRMDARGVQKWQVSLNPKYESRLASSPIAENLPTIKPVWGNATREPDSLIPNLLAGEETTFRVTQAQTPFRDQGMRRPTDSLIDGESKPPTEPWLSWSILGSLDFYKVALEVDAKQPLRVNGVTFVEDPAHPESWLRDMRMQVLDSATNKWIDGPYLVSDAATHTHKLDKPLEGSKFRFIGTGNMLQEWRWPMGNIRLSEIVFHGTKLEK